MTNEKNGAQYPWVQKELTFDQFVTNFFEDNSPKEVQKALWEIYAAAQASEDFSVYSPSERGNLAHTLMELIELIDRLSINYKTLS